MSAVPGRPPPKGRVCSAGRRRTAMEAGGVEIRGEGQDWVCC